MFFFIYFFSEGRGVKEIDTNWGQTLGSSKNLLGSRGKELKFCSHFYFSLVNRHLGTFAEYDAFLVHQNTKRNTLKPFVVLFFQSHYKFFSGVELKQCLCGTSFWNKGDIERCLWVERLINQKKSFQRQTIEMTWLLARCDEHLC